jgi:hypothetical protein
VVLKLKSKSLFWLIVLVDWVLMVILTWVSRECEWVSWLGFKLKWVLSGFFLNQFWVCVKCRDLGGLKYSGVVEILGSCWPNGF